MRRVAVFGNAGGGKSTLARRLAAATQLPLHVIDEMQFRAGRVAVPQEEYPQNHAEMLSRAEWIIDGFGGASSKRVHHLRSRAEIEAFIARVERERSHEIGRG